jgi:hypothetical protein
MAAEELLNEQARLVTERRAQAEAAQAARRILNPAPPETVALPPESDPRGGARQKLEPESEMRGRR